MGDEKNPEKDFEKKTKKKIEKENEIEKSSIYWIVYKNFSDKAEYIHEFLRMICWIWECILYK